MNYKKSLIALTVFAYIIFLNGNSSFSKSRIKWYDFNTGIKLAEKQKKPVMIDFFARSCHWCLVMDRETFSNRSVIKNLKRYYIPIRINFDSYDKVIYKGKIYSIREFSTTVGVEGLPTIVFMDKNGKFITKIPGYIRSNTFIPLLGYIRKECYKNVSFKEYLNGKIKCN